MRYIPYLALLFVIMTMIYVNNKTNEASTNQKVVYKTVYVDQYGNGYDFVSEKQ